MSGGCLKRSPNRVIRLGSLLPLKAAHGGVRITGDNAVARPADDHSLVSLFDNSEALPGMPDARPDCAAAATAGEDLPAATAGRLAPSYLPPTPLSPSPPDLQGVTTNKRQIGVNWNFAAVVDQNRITPMRGKERRRTKSPRESCDRSSAHRPGDPAAVTPLQCPAISPRDRCSRLSDCRSRRGSRKTRLASSRRVLVGLARKRAVPTLDPPDTPFPQHGLR